MNEKGMKQNFGGFMICELRLSFVSVNNNYYENSDNINNK